MGATNREMYEAFRGHFRDRFVHLSDLPVQVFRSYLADFLHLQKAEAACCERLDVKSVMR